MDVSALKESDGFHELHVLNAQELGGFGGVETLGTCNLRNVVNEIFPVFGYPEIVVF